MTSLKVNRRSFLAGSAAVGAALVAGVCGCGPKDDVEWDEETEVIVVGGGGAGITAAVVAMRDGAEVIVLEKAPEPGGSTALSGGVIQAAGTDVQVGQGITDDSAQKHYDDYEQAAEGIAQPALLKTLTGNAKGAIAFMEELGLEYQFVYPVDPIPTVDPEVMLARIHVAGAEVTLSGGALHHAKLMEAFDGLSGDLRTSATVKSLIEDADEGIVGVEVEIDGVVKNIRARRAVILACGGIDHHTELARNYSPQQSWKLDTGLCLYAPTNTGDGVVMAMDVGADLACLGGTIGYPAATMGTRTSDGIEGTVPGIWVNRRGQRFVSEADHYAFVMRAVFDQENHEAWAIFDANVAALGGGVLGGFFGSFSDDLSDEIADGTIISGSTLSDLATALSIEPSLLDATVSRWNEDVSKGRDLLFGRDVGLVALSDGPFYALPVTSVNLGTCGGVKIDDETRVQSLWGSAILRLFAAGMVAGGFIGPYYPGSGTAILSTVVFGRIAGANAASQDALEPVLKSSKD